MLFKNANIFVGGKFRHGSFRAENGRFTEILTTVPAEGGIDLNDQYVIPGLVDVHNHGNSGADFSDGDYDGLVKMARYLAQNGVTSFAPASMTLPYDVLETAYKTAVRLRNEQPEGCARLMGIQMEGPFFSEKKKGAQNGAYLREPDFAAFKRLYDASEGLPHRGCGSGAARCSEICRKSVQALHRLYRAHRLHLRRSQRGL
jgi:N-acetylglucosamine-6-phosphate deacetylase